VNSGVQCRWRIKNRDSRCISGSSLLEVTCHQHLDNMRPIVLTVHALYTNATLPRISGDIVYHRGCCKNTQKCNIFAYNGLPWGATTPWLTFWKAFVELMLSSNWHVTLRLILFEIFAVEWLLEAKTDFLSL